MIQVLQIKSHIAVNTYVIKHINLHRQPTLLSNPSPLNYLSTCLETILVKIPCIRGEALVSSSNIDFAATFTVHSAIDVLHY